MKLALIGAGQRGMIYAEYAYFKKGAQIVSIVEPHAERRKIAAEKFHVADEFCFACVEEFFAKDRRNGAIYAMYMISGIPLIITSAISMKFFASGDFAAGMKL